MTRLLDGAAVVTGAAGAGISSATVRRCLERGAKVVLGDIHGAHVEAVGPALCDWVHREPASSVTNEVLGEQPAPLMLASGACALTLAQRRPSSPAGPGR